jgi:hypothetical protein
MATSQSAVKIPKAVVDQGRVTAIRMAKKSAVFSRPASVFQSLIGLHGVSREGGGIQ